MVGCLRWKVEANPYFKKHKQEHFRGFKLKLDKMQTELPVQINGLNAIDHVLSNLCCRLEQALNCRWSAKATFKNYSKGFHFT